MLKRITDQEEIGKVLRAYLLQPKRQASRFIAAIKDSSRNLIYEGAAPLSCSSDDDGTTWTLTNMDSSYTQAIGQVRQSDIEYLETLLPL